MVYFYSAQSSQIYEEEIDKWQICYINDLSEIIKKLSESKILTLDTETTGLNPFVDNIIMLQFGDLNDQYVIDTRGLDLSIFNPIFECKDRLFIGHNIKFDYNMLKKHNILLYNVYDTMLAEMVIQNGKYSIDYIRKNSPFSLKILTKKYVNVNIGKETREEFLNKGHSPFTLSQILYGAKDVYYPFLIKQEQEKIISQYELEKTVSLECKSSLALGDIQYNGIYLNENKWIETNKIFKHKLKKTLIDLDNILINKDIKYKLKFIQLNLFEDVKADELKRQTNINWNSSAQVIDILTNVFNIFPKDKSGKLSSGSNALKSLSDKPDIVKTLLIFRKQSKAVSSFGYSFLEKFQYPDKRIRTTFNSIVETGRVSSRNPNMQQIPKDDMFRSCFEASSENTVLINADYANQEGRIMADMSGDKNYIDFFNYGDGDAHSFVARTLFSAAKGEPIEVNDDKSHPNYYLRHQGKILNFFISFGGSAHTLSDTLKISLEEADYLIENFFKGFPGLKIMFDNSSDFALNRGYIRTNNITNRIRWMREWPKYQELSQKLRKEITKEEFKLLNKLKGRIKRKGMNTPIQGQWPCLNRVNSGKAEMLILSQAS